MAAGGANVPLDTLELMFSEDTQSMPRKDYEYPEHLIFLRDVDERPLLLKEKDLKEGLNAFTRIFD